MFDILMHPKFAKWRAALKDQRGKAKIAQRIVRIQAGNFGDAKFFDGIGELRIKHGPGYRVYFMQHGGRVIILMCAGDKSSQKRDIQLAKQIAEEIRENGIEAH